MKEPSTSSLVFVTGHRGTGKTVEGLYQLSQMPFDEMPFVMLDFKHNDHVAAMPVNEIVSIHEEPPTDPGLYVARVTVDDTEPRGAVSRFLTRCQQRGHIGLFIDEGRRLGHGNAGLRLVCAEGRSQHVPLIFVCQRPAFVDTWALSEADYLTVFNLFHPEDHARVWGFIPPDRLDFDRLRSEGKYHSYTYEVESNELELRQPCENFDAIYRRVLGRLPRYEDAPGAPPGTVVRL